MESKVRLAALATLTAMVLGACGDGGTTGTGATDTAVPEATATDAPSPTTAPESSTPGASPTTQSLSDEEQECLDAFVRFLKDVEDVVEGFDFESATLFDFQAFSLALVPAGEALAEQVEGIQCTGLGGMPPDEIVPILLDIVRTEAPGSVAYLELLFALSELPVEGSCMNDIAALQAYVDAGGTVSDLTVPERFHAFSLAASIDGTCRLVTAGHFLNSDEVARFLEID